MAQGVDSELGKHQGVVFQKWRSTAMDVTLDLELLSTKGTTKNRVKLSAKA
jgi:hypothetical protein